MRPRDWQGEGLESDHPSTIPGQEKDQQESTLSKPLLACANQVNETGRSLGAIGPPQMRIELTV